MSVFTAPITWVINGLATEVTITFTDGFSRLAMAAGFSVRSSGSAVKLQELNVSPSCIDLKVATSGSVTVSSPIASIYPDVSVTVLCNDSGVSVQYSFNDSSLIPITSSLGSPGYSFAFPSLGGIDE